MRGRQGNAVEDVDGAPAGGGEGLEGGDEVLDFGEGGGDEVSRGGGGGGAGLEEGELGGLGFVSLTSGSI